MGEKRSSNDQNDARKKKKFKISSGFLDPGTSGIYATCVRRKERLAVQELGLFLEEKVEEVYKDDLEQLRKENDENDEESEEELSIENQIQKELAELKKAEALKTKEEKKKELLKFIDLNCECVIFCKTKRPIDPEHLVAKIMEESADPSNKVKRTRYINKLTPITYSCSASMEQITKLIEKVVLPRFHEQKDPKALKFAVEINRRNFSTIPKMDIINQVVKMITKGGEYPHKVDLKEYDFLVIVECFKNNVGMSVVNSDYVKKYRKYNLQQIYQAKFKDDDVSQ
ncbi:hypothetical protein KAFR_0J02800 [Kazachstania africana CBS 2517]|uniref:THUMP domain-containing protein n=1 Tax=Kazachstania africana (strain ATCC 22294 / BCRC 22015 / CBS 2517 / CECT 1963 / NBRC 1671 / NRRL Y-8276) TaxID=1071382 RepID=H2B144_KAZAF|nr:hypothetical protein KAFR_0J02800 [Kazachstania africana CBS 2517]CCF60344.1 hypothetical protein KAFR_0J02800 [Kazachstania africana CBS 2517]